MPPYLFLFLIESIDEGFLLFFIKTYNCKLGMIPNARKFITIVMFGFWLVWLLVFLVILAYDIFALVPVPRCNYISIRMYFKQFQPVACSDLNLFFQNKNQLKLEVVYILIEKS